MRLFAALLTACLCLPAAAQPLTTAFTFQGGLTDAGAPANGAFDLRFRLFTAASGGSQVGSTLCVNDLTVAAGEFSTQLDFGAAFAGQRRYLEVQVRPGAVGDCTNAAGYTTLAPRSEVTASPHATFALAATNASTLGGQAPSFFQDATNLSAGTVADTRLSTNVPRLNSANSFTSNVTAPTFIGALSGNASSATNATNLNSQPASFYTNATNLSAGTLADARLSTNIPRLSAGSNSFVGSVSAALFTGPLSGNAATATNATNLSGQPGSFYTNASNLTSGTLPEPRLPSTVARTNSALVDFGGSLTILNRLSVGDNVSTYPEEVHVRGTGTFGRIAMDPGGTDQFTELAFWENLSNTNGIILREDGRSIGNCLVVIDATAGTEAAIATFDRDDNSFSALVKAFRIDHPLDPANKELWHSCVESPDMLNIYSGVTTTDDAGEAIITLPTYFAALNIDHRYQLTIIDDPAAPTDAFPLAKVSRAIGLDAPNTFSIRTSVPNTRVSWQVTGIRNDAVAQRFRIVPERDKPAELRGTYLCPEAFAPATGPQN